MKKNKGLLEAVQKAYNGGRWKAGTNKKKQLINMFIAGAEHIQRWISINDKMPVTSDGGVSNNVLLKLSVYSKKHKNTDEYCIEAYYDRDIEHWYTIIVNDKNLVLTL